MIGHRGSSASSYLADPTSPIPSHCASIVASSTLRVKATSLYTYLSLFECYKKRITLHAGESYRFDARHTAKKLKSHHALQLIALLPFLSFILLHLNIWIESVDVDRVDRGDDEVFLLHIEEVAVHTKLHSGGWVELLIESKHFVVILLRHGYAWNKPVKLSLTLTLPSPAAGVGGSLTVTVA